MMRWILYISMNVTHRPLTYKQLSAISINGRRQAMITEVIGNRIRDLRSGMGVSQEKLALKADLDRTYLASVENGKRNLSVRNLEKIINALDVSFQEFFNDI